MLEEIELTGNPSDDCIASAALPAYELEPEETEAECEARMEAEYMVAEEEREAEMYDNRGVDQQDEDRREWERDLGCVG